MSFWYKIRTSFSSSSSSFVSILNAFHTPMKDCDGYDSISNELSVGMTSNNYFVNSCLTYYNGGYGTYIRSSNNKIILNGYPLIIKTLNQVNSNYDALVPLETSFISGKYVIPENIPSSAPNNLQRGTIPVTYSIDSKEYMYMFFAGESNPPWANPSYTNKTVVRTWGGYNIPSNTNTPGANYPDDNAIFSDAGIIGDEYIGKIIDFGKDPQEVPQIVVDFFEKFFEKKYDDGSLDMNLYHNNAEQNRLDKTNFLENVSTLNGYLRDKTSITNPSIIIEMNDFPTFNYVYLPKFNRYYYVTNIISIATNLWQIDMHVDVLMSYRDEILDTECIIERNQYDYNAFLVDKNLPCEKARTLYMVSDTIRTKINPFLNMDDYCFVLQVVK